MEKFSCPKCGQPMETADELTGQQITCVSCGQSFIPVRHVATLLAQDKSNNQVRRNGRLIMVFAAVLAVLALVVFVGAIVEWHNEAAAAHGEDSAPFFATAYWFLKAAIVLYVVAQITFIRANTERSER
jgi:cytochrome bd-type quinol oxidase subunit 2